MHRAGKTRDAAERRMWSVSVLCKYWALQVPEAALVVVILLLLQGWLGFSTWLTWSLAGLWVAKDAVLYPFVWRSFDPHYPATMHALDGEQGVATERLDRTGYVQVRGEIWHAELGRGARPVDKDELVEVRETRGRTLIVAAVNE